MSVLNRILGFAVLVSINLAAAGGNAPLTLENQHLAISFSSQTGGIVSIADPETHHKFVSQPSAEPLSWRLVLKNRSGKEVTLENAQAAPPQIETETDSLTVKWTGFDLADQQDVLDIRMECLLEPDSDTAYLRLWVDNRSDEFGLWDVQFPVIDPLAGSEISKVAMGRGTWGMMYDSSEKKISGEYPSHSLPMQFVLIQENNSGLYLAAHDPSALFKTFEVERGGEFHVKNRVIDMGVPDNDWTDPYPFAVSVYQGDWMTGCKRYREWALKEAPWTRKGPLTNRSDVPKSIKNVCAWLLASGSPEEVVPAVLKFADAIGAPVGVHWYNWHEIPFDHEYPNYFPTKVGFASGVAELVDRGIVVMPYINARLWDSTNDNFAEAKPHCVKDEAGNPVLETYGKSPPLAPMCPTQPFWQNKVAEIIHRLVEECGVNAIYLDQIASAAPRTCFDPNHGHPLGSGRWWVDGYREMLTPIKQSITSEGGQVGLTTENDAEPYMDNVDGHLIWTSRSDQEIPINTAVYSGYTLYFASNRAFGFGGISYCLCQARDFVWGTQLGWDGAGLLEPEHREELEFLGRLARLRAKALDYLVYGELLALLEPTNDVPSLSGTWNKPGGDGPVTLKAVQGALWKGTDGSAGVFLANADTQPHPFSFEVDAQSHGLGPSDNWSVKRITSSEMTSAPPQEGNRFDYTIEVPGRDAVLVVFRPETKP
ncbi:MAG: hypothetical protein H6751_05090 [Candidatus Omnitrophica bacterium]|nr:hypothetical protein [Candidatus Omnitrophota bacterium]